MNQSSTYRLWKKGFKKLSIMTSLNDKWLCSYLSIRNLIAVFTNVPIAFNTIPQRFAWVRWKSYWTQLLFENVFVACRNLKYKTGEGIHCLICMKAHSKSTHMYKFYSVLIHHSIIKLKCNPLCNHYQCMSHSLSIL